PAEMLVSTPLAASTSSALSNAGCESACVSMPMNSGPPIARSRRRSQIACVIASTCASLNVPSSEEPRWPEVPKRTRSPATAASGRRSKKADRSASTATSADSGSRSPGCVKAPPLTPRFLRARGRRRVKPYRPASGCLASELPVVLFIVLVDVAAEQAQVLQLFVVGRVRVPHGVVVTQRPGVGERPRLTEAFAVVARVGAARIAVGRDDPVDADVQARLHRVAARAGALSGTPRIAVARQVTVADVGAGGIRSRAAHVIAIARRQPAEVVAHAGPA